LCGRALAFVFVIEGDLEGALLVLSNHGNSRGSRVLIISLVNLAKA
jgi:hypothetical protein